MWHTLADLAHILALLLVGYTLVRLRDVVREEVDAKLDEMAEQALAELRSHRG